MLKLSNEQIELAAKYLAASNTGLVGDYEFPEPRTTKEIEVVYARISYEYENELGEGLESEFKSWKKDIKAGKYHELITERIPFIL